MKSSKTFWNGGDKLKIYKLKEPLYFTYEDSYVGFIGLICAQEDDTEFLLVGLTKDKEGVIPLGDITTTPVTFVCDTSYPPQTHKQLLAKLEAGDFSVISQLFQSSPIIIEYQVDGKLTQILIEQLATWDTAEIVQTIKKLEKRIGQRGEIH